MSDPKALITRVESDTHRRVKERAADDHRSVSSWLRAVIHEALEAEPKQHSKQHA